MLRNLTLLALTATAGLPLAATLPASENRVQIRITHHFDGRPLRFDDVSLRNRAGDVLSVSRLCYLISDVAFRRADGTEVKAAGQYAFIDASDGRTAFSLDGVPPGKFMGISFTIGLPPSTNHGDPAAWPAGHPLNPLVNRLHWSWQGGYIFLAVEGRRETPGAKLGGYAYHLANDRCRMRVTLPGDFELRDGGTLSLGFDVARVFDSSHTITVGAAGGDSTHSAAGDDLARYLAENVERAFSLEGALRPSPHGRGAGGEGLPRGTGGARSVVPGVGPFAPLRAGSTAPSSAPPPGTTPYAFAIPARFPQPGLPADNPLTVEGVALGKRLFFDKRLSGNDTQSCASCHQPENAFSDGGKALSHGITGEKGTRNAMPLFNLAWSPAYTWDGRRARLRDQALAPIQDTREMNQTLDQAVAELRADADYPGQFARAFGTEGVTAERMGLALEQFLLTLVAADSKFDRALRKEETLTDEEKRGFLLFFTEYEPRNDMYGADCFHCHGGVLFVNETYADNGLDVEPRDAGRATVTGREADRGKFKTPSLRNVALTAPYMHDGRFRTLEEVVGHYSGGVRRSKSLHPTLAKHPDGGIRLSAEDKKALVTFLKTLTDHRLSATMAGVE